MTRALLLLPFLAACGGEDPTVRALFADMTVVPETPIEFGEVGIFDEAVEIVTILNPESNGPDLEVEFTLTGDGEFSIPLGTATLEPEEQLALEVMFAPETALPFTGQLTITAVGGTDPKDTPEPVVIDLSGSGLDLPLPDICFDTEPLVMDWGPVAAGESDLKLMHIRNCGRAPLELGVVEQSGSGAFRMDLDSDPSNGIVAPDGVATVPVFYEPVTEDGDNGTFTIHSNDPDEPTVEVVLLGNGGGAGLEFPVAVIDCPATTAPPSNVSLDGSGSYDPAGNEPLTYAWFLNSKPQGSAAALTNAITDSTALNTDIAGDYEVQLQVFNSIGLPSAPERCFIDAVPADDIHVELTWDTTGVDLDLHMLQSTTDELFDTPNDCNWCNKNPTWADPGNPDDDPRLDLDDLSDGPENINIRTPASGAYPVLVHYYDPVGGPATTATVTVYANGVDVWSGSIIMTRNEVWEVGQVNWPAGSFGQYNTPLYTAVRRQCQ